MGTSRLNQLTIIVTNSPKLRKQAKNQRKICFVIEQHKRILWIRRETFKIGSLESNIHCILAHLPTTMRTTNMIQAIIILLDDRFPCFNVAPSRKKHLQNQQQFNRFRACEALDHTNLFFPIHIYTQCHIFITYESFDQPNQWYPQCHPTQRMPLLTNAYNDCLDNTLSTRRSDVRCTCNHSRLE